MDAGLLEQYSAQKSMKIMSMITYASITQMLMQQKISRTIRAFSDLLKILFQKKNLYASALITSFQANPVTLTIHGMQQRGQFLQISTLCHAIS